MPMQKHPVEFQTAMEELANWLEEHRAITDALIERASKCIKNWSDIPDVHQRSIVAMATAYHIARWMDDPMTWQPRGKAS